MKRIITYTIAAILTLATFRVVAEPAGNEATTEVVVSGVGLDADKALRNALMNAVQQAVGLIVDAEALVKNENLIKDQVLTYSDGYVEHFDTIKEGKRDDGLYEIKIKAIVKRRQLIEKLRETKVIASKVDGASIFGEVVTQLTAEKNAGALLKHALEGLPLSLLRVEVVNQKPKIDKQSETGVQATWTVLITYDQKEYTEKVLPKLQNLLGDIARKAAVPYAGKPHSDFSTPAYDQEFKHTLNGIPHNIRFVLQKPHWYITPNEEHEGPNLPPVNENEFPVLLHRDFTDRPDENVRLRQQVRTEIRRDPQFQRDEVVQLGQQVRTNMQERFVCYVLDKSLKPILEAVSSRQPLVRVALLNADGQTLVEELIRIPMLEPGSSDGVNGWFITYAIEAGGAFLISPSVRCGAQSNYNRFLCRGIEIRWSADLSLETMKQVTKIQCQLVEQKTNAPK